MLPKNWGETMGAPAIFEKQIEIKLLHPASTEESRIQVFCNVMNLVACRRPLFLDTAERDGISGE
ncbi:MAG: hypothetical protein P8X74_23880 [Reinekea sp.]